MWCAAEGTPVGSRLLGREEETATRKPWAGARTSAPAPGGTREAPSRGAGSRVCQRRQRAQPSYPKGHRKAHRRPSAEGEARASQCPQEAHWRENGDCRQAERGPPPAAERGAGAGSEHARGGCQAKESSKPGRRPAGRLEEGSRKRRKDHAQRLRPRRRGKQPGRSAQRGRRETPSLGRDTSGWRRTLLPGQRSPRGPGEPQPKVVGPQSGGSTWSKRTWPRGHSNQ